MELKPEIKLVLNKIEFVKRYETISSEHKNFKKRYSDFSVERALYIFQNLGYNFSYHRKENFFEIEEKVNEFVFIFNIKLKSGIVEFIWSLENNGEIWKLGGPWGVIADLLLSQEERLPLTLPVFTSYDELKQILKSSFEIYEDFKKELLKMDYE